MAEHRPPLTFRLISWLPGPFWFWALIWAASGFARSVVNVIVLNAAGDRGDAQRVLDNLPTASVLLVLLVAVMLFGTRLLWQRAQLADAAVDRLDGDTDERAWSFPGIGNTLGALGVGLALALAVEASSLSRFPGWFAFYDVPWLFLLSLPVGGFLWAYATVLVGVDRLGRQALKLEPFPGDRTLGLKPIGNLVFVGFGIVLVGASLYVAALGRYLGDFLVVAAAFLVVAALLVLSMWRLHHQMVSAKDEYVTRARALYVAAYEPLRSDPSMETLEAQSRKLSAAESIEKRAESIHEWPVDDRTLARFAVVATGVLTGLLLRVVLTFVGI